MSTRVLRNLVSSLQHRWLHSPLPCQRVVSLFVCSLLFTLLCNFNSHKLGYFATLVFHFYVSRTHFFAAALSLSSTLCTLLLNLSTRQLSLPFRLIFLLTSVIFLSVFPPHSSYLLEIPCFSSYLKITQAAFTHLIFRQVKPDVHLSHLANNCTQLQLNLLRTYNNSPQNAFEVVKNDDLAFVMVTANASKLQSELNNLRRTPKKFICLNDDIDYGQIARSQLAIQEVNLVKQVLNDFYSSFLPHPSPFELPQGEVNSILHVKPYKERVKCAKKVTTLSPPHANSPGEEYLLVNISISTPVILVIFFLIFRLFTKVSICFSIFTFTIFTLSHFSLVLSAF